MVRLFKRKVKINSRIIDGYNCVGKFPAHVEFIKLGQCVERLHSYDKMMAQCHQDRLRLKTMEKPVIIESISFLPQTIELHSMLSSADKTGRSYPFIFQASSSLSLALELPELSLLTYLPLFERLHQLYKQSPQIDELCHLSSWFNGLVLSESQMTKAQLYEQALHCYKSTKVASLFTIGQERMSKMDVNSVGSGVIHCWFPVNASMASLISYLQLMKQSNQELSGFSLVWRFIDDHIDSVYALDTSELDQLFIHLYNYPNLTSSELAAKLDNQTAISAPNLMAHSTLYDWINLT